MLGEDEELAAAVLEFGELGVLETGFRRAASFESDACSRTRRACSTSSLQRGDLGPKLVEFLSGGVLVDQGVAVAVVEVVLVLLGVDQAALELRRAAWPAGPG